MTISGTPHSHSSGGPQGVSEPKAVKQQEQASPAKPKGSQVEVSDSARQMAELSKLVRDAPDARADLVNDIKQRIEAGTYEVNLDKLAEKLSDVI